MNSSARIGQRPDLKNFFALSTPSDGSCLLHAVFFATSARYRAKTRKERFRYVRDFRNTMGKLLPSFWKKTELPILGQELPKEYSLEALTEEFFSSQNLGEFAVWYLSLLLEVNIVIFDAKTESVYHRGPDSYSLSYQSTVLIRYIGSHFETIVYQDPNDHLYHLTFQPDSEIVQRIHG